MYFMYIISGFHVGPSETWNGSHVDCYKNCICIISGPVSSRITLSSLSLKRIKENENHQGITNRRNFKVVLKSPTKVKSVCLVWEVVATPWKPTLQRSPHAQASPGSSRGGEVLARETTRQLGEATLGRHQGSTQLRESQQVTFYGKKKNRIEIFIKFKTNKTYSISSL